MTNSTHFPFLQTLTLLLPKLKIVTKNPLTWLLLWLQQL